MENLEEQLKNASHIKMTPSERSFMRANIASFMNIHDIRQGKYVKSPYHHFWNPLLVTLCSIMFIIASGGTVSYSAKGALPGDALYNFKLNVTEEVQGILITSPTQKIIWQQNRVAKRIDEVKQLAANGELTLEKATIVEKAIEEHIAKVDEKVQILAKENPQELAKTTDVLNSIIANHDKDLKELEQIENTKTEVKDAENKASLLKKEETKNIDSTTSTTNTVYTNTGILPVPTESSSTIKIPEIKEKALEKSESSTALINILSKIQKESESINEIIKPLDEKNTDVVDSASQAIDEVEEIDKKPIQ